MRHYSSGDLRWFTTDELQTAFRLKGQRLSITAIAERLNRSPAVLRQAMRKPPALPIDIRHAINEEIVREFESGSRIIDIARKRDWPFKRVEERLTQAGLDGEMRQAIRAELAATLEAS